MQSEQRGRDRQDLKELAKLASSAGSVPPPSRNRTTATSESSGFIDLAALQAADKDWLSKAIANGSPLQASAASTLGGAGGSVVGGSYDGVVHAPSAAPPPLRLEAPSVAALASSPRADAPPRRGWLYASGALVLLAGTGFLFRNSLAGSHDEPQASVTEAVVAPAPVAAKAVEALAPVVDTPAPAAVGAPAEAPAAPAADAPAAGLVAVNSKKAGSHAHAGAAHPQATAAATDDDAPVPAPSKKIPAFAAAAAGVPAPAAPAAGGALAQALRSAVGPAGQAAAAPVKAAPAAPVSNANVPDRPPAPAVTTAIRNALPAARNCLKAGDPESRVVLTFSSGGSISGVQTSGAGASCIKGALAGVKVPAFSQPSYTAAVTVRPNG